MADIQVTPEQVRTLEGGELVALCRDVAVEINRLQALLAVASNQIWEDSEGHDGQDTLTKEFGCRSTVELLQRVTGEPASVVSARLKVGRQVTPRQSLVGEELVPLQEHVAAGLGSGRLNMNAAVHISKVLVKNGRAHPEDLEMAERCLVQAATGLDFATGDEPGVPLHADDVRRLCVAWDAGLDPDGVAPSEEERDRKRFFNIGPIRDGMARVNGLVKAEVAAMFTTIMDTVNNPRVNAEGLPFLGEGEGEPAGEGEAAGAAEGALESLDGDDVRSDDVVRVADDGLFPVEDAVEFDGGAGGPGGPGGTTVGLDPTDDRSWGQRRHDVLAMALGVTLADADLPILQGAGATIVVEIHEDSLIDDGLATHGFASHGGSDATGGPGADGIDGSGVDGADGSGVDGADGSGVDGADGSGADGVGGSDADGVGGRHGPRGSGRSGVGWLVDHEGASSPISAEVVHRMACNGNVQAVVRNSLGKIIGLGSQERLFTPVQRRGIALRDGGCVIPGCSVPSAWCEVHHVHPHSDGGPTHTDNGVLLCRYHHSTIDSGGWVISMHAGIPVVRPPEWLTRMYAHGHRRKWMNYAMNAQARRIQQTLARQKHRRKWWRIEKPPPWNQYT